MKSYPLILEGFLSEEETAVLLDASVNAHEAFEESFHLSPQERYKGKIALHKSIRRLYSRDAGNIMIDVTKRVLDLVKETDGTDDIWIEAPQFSRWSVGDALNPGHADNCEADGSPNSSPHRSHGVVVYLNEDFEGGTLFYPNQEIEFEPKAGSVAIHGGGLDYLHGVTEVTEGMRHTMATFLTTDADHYNNHRQSFL